MTELSASPAETITEEVVTPVSEAYALARRLGKLCFEAGLDPVYMGELVTIVYREEKQKG